MIISPIGTWVTRVDTALTGSLDALIGAAVNYASTPIALCACLYYVTQGVRLAQGDAQVMHNFWGRLIRVGILIWLSTNLTAFNLWIRDLVFLGIPASLNAALGPAVGLPPGNVATVAALFDSEWSQIWVASALVWEQLGFSASGMLAGLSGMMTAIIGGLGLAFIAMIYVGARMVFAILVCLTPFIMILGIFDGTKDIVNRAIGKAISLIIMQVAGFVVMEIVLLGNQWFLAQATNAIISAMTDRNLQAQSLQAMAAICAWFAVGAYGVWEIRGLAYSLGSGAGQGGVALINFAALGLRGSGDASAARGPSLPSLPGVPSLPSALGPIGVNPVDTALPPPPAPPALSHSTRS